MAGGARNLEVVGNVDVNRWIAGAVFGLAGAFLLRQTPQAQLYKTGAMDPRVVAAVAAVLVIVAMIACVLPARRAAKTDPLIALSDA